MDSSGLHSTAIRRRDTSLNSRERISIRAGRRQRSGRGRQCLSLPGILVAIVLTDRLSMSLQTEHLTSRTSEEMRDDNLDDHCQCRLSSHLPSNIAQVIFLRIDYSRCPPFCFIWVTGKQVGKHTVPSVGSGDSTMMLVCQASPCNPWQTAWTYCWGRFRQL